MLKEWLGAMQKEIQKIDRDTYFITITHSQSQATKS